VSSWLSCRFSSRAPRRTSVRSASNRVCRPTPPPVRSIRQVRSWTRSRRMTSNTTSWDGEGNRGAVYETAARHSGLNTSGSQSRMSSER
jgi:hypothetical protein